MSEGRGVVDAGAVPALVAELVLAFGGGEADAVAHCHHGVRRGAAHLPLPAGEAGDAAAKHLRAQSEDTINPGTKTK